MIIDELPGSMFPTVVSEPSSSKGAATIQRTISIVHTKSRF